MRNIVVITGDNIQGLARRLLDPGRHAESTSDAAQADNAAPNMDTVRC